MAIVIVLTVVEIGLAKKENLDTLKESESKVVESSQIERTTETKEEKTTKATEKATEEKSTSAKEEKTTNVQAAAPVVETTKNVVPTTQASKPVVTTKPSVKPTTTKPAPKPTTTKAPKDEYYPSLTEADMECLSKYTADYIKSKGYRHRPDLDWDSAGYSTTVGMNDDLSMYGNKYKLNGGISPLEWAKNDVRDCVDYYIEIFGENTPSLEMDFLYKRNGTGWRFTVGYMV